jgi:maltooligosyltrehalose trehalohydrolase
MVCPVVWAPGAGVVRFVIDGVAQAAVRESDGRWRCPNELEPGQRYFVQVDEQPPVADPRALDLPDGLDGPARVFDPTTVAWTDAEYRPVPWSDAVVYELHVGTFTQAGTLDAAADKLEHFVDLGVTHVELMPVSTFPGERGWGYDGVFPYSVHAAYGGPAALVRFVDAAHARGLAVLLDVVYNHLGPGAERLSCVAPYFATDKPTPWGPSFDLQRAEVRSYLRDNARGWLRDFHLDGLRLDAVQVIEDEHEPHILAELADDARRLSQQTGRPYVLIAETIFNDRHMVESRDDGGYGLDAHWHEDFHHALQAALTGERSGYYADYGSLETLATILRTGYWFDGTRASAFHGQTFGASPAGLHGRQLQSYLQTHDQVGNRPDGARIHVLAGEAGARIGSALTLLGPFVPMLFQGEEWGASSPFHFFCDHGPLLGTQVREGRRRDLAHFGFDTAAMLDPEDPDTRDRCVLDWGERDHDPHASMLAWYRRLIAIRKSQGAVDPKDVTVEYDASARWLVMRNGPVEVVADFASPQVTVRVDGRVELASPSVVDDGR